jgi:dihydrofolate synthase/folylpolyglutamate synthase
MIAHLAYEGGGGNYSVGHYSSPHILRFNERIWLNGIDADDRLLENGHRRLFTILGRTMSEALSYFEYSTLLALLLFEECDLVILEAGLGGEFDATNVCGKVLSVVTPIGIDHQAFLGDTIEEIAATKLRSIRKRVLLAPQPYREVEELARQISEEKGATLYRYIQQKRRDSHGTLNLFEEEQSSSIEVSLPRTSSRFLEEIAKSKGWPAYLQENASIAICALDLLGIDYAIEELRSLDLFGRFYSLARNIRIDVGHNPLAAQAIVSALEDKVVLIYNSLDDKDYSEVLRILKPKVKRVEIIPVNSQRGVTMRELETVLEEQAFAYSEFNGVIDPQEYYLVFGSFYTVEAFLESYHASE